MCFNSLTPLRSPVSQVLTQVLPSPLEEMEAKQGDMTEDRGVGTGTRQPAVSPHTPLSTPLIKF